MLINEMVIRGLLNSGKPELAAKPVLNLDCIYPDVTIDSGKVQYRITDKSITVRV